MREETLIIELHYLPCIQYFVYLNSFNRVIIDLNDQYTKQTYRNRCRINGANKVENLIIPVKKIRSGGKFTSEIEIDYNQKWLRKHLRAIQSSYGKAPFFEYYVDDLFNIFNKKPRNLLSLNKALLTKCLELLNFELNLEFAAGENENKKNFIKNAKNEINPKNSISKNSIYDSQIYFQVFGNNFVNNLSIIDLIFCEGPQARHIIQKSCASH